MQDQSEFYAALAAHASTARGGLRSALATERTATLDSAKRALAQTRDRETARLRRDLGSTEVAHTRALEALEAELEATRRACAGALLGEAFDPARGLPALVRAWRDEPGRKATSVIQQQWRELNERAEAELGAELGVHVLGACFMEQLAVEIPGSLSRLSGISQGMTVDIRCVEALGAWSRTAAGDPGAASDALERVESALVAVARRGAHATVEPRHEELFALHRANATRADLLGAIEAYNARWAKIDAENFAATYVPPPSLSERLRGWLTGDHAEP